MKTRISDNALPAVRPKSPLREFFIRAGPGHQPILGKAFSPILRATGLRTVYFQLSAADKAAGEQKIQRLADLAMGVGFHLKSSKNGEVIHYSIQAFELVIKHSASPQQIADAQAQLVDIGQPDSGRFKLFADVSGFCSQPSRIDELTPFVKMVNTLDPALANKRIDRLVSLFDEQMDVLNRLAFTPLGTFPPVHKFVPYYELPHTLVSILRICQKEKGQEILNLKMLDFRRYTESEKISLLELAPLALQVRELGLNCTDLDFNRYRSEANVYLSKLKGNGDKRHLQNAIQCLEVAALLCSDEVQLAEIVKQQASVSATDINLYQKPVEIRSQSNITGREPKKKSRNYYWDNYSSSQDEEPVSLLDEFLGNY